MLGWTPRRDDTTTVPRMPSSRLTANEMSVPMNVTSRTRTGIAYQRGGRGVGGMVLGYTMRCVRWRWSDHDLDQKNTDRSEVKSLESVSCGFVIWLESG